MAAPVPVKSWCLLFVAKKLLVKKWNNLYLELVMHVAPLG
jgi:hypothetical protein